MMTSKKRIETLDDPRGIACTFSTVKAGQRGLFTVYEKTFDIKGTPLVMVYVPAGEFIMGSNDDFSAKPAHHVKIERAFYMGKFPITQLQWKSVMGNNPSYFSGNESLPVEKVNWDNCQIFCHQLSVLLDKPFRLPSEAEWEYACRAGTSTNYWWGDKIKDIRCWHNNNSGGKTHPVDEEVNKHTNPFGLCDMHGNVWEWCEDSWEGSYNTPKTQQPSKNSNGRYVVVRGGSWFDDACYFDSALRGMGDISDQDFYLGFRLVFLS